jgi:hypothetical protein
MIECLLIIDFSCTVSGSLIDCLKAAIASVTFLSIFETELMYTSKISHCYTGCSRTRSPEKRGEIFIKGQINNPNKKMFYLERYSRKEQFNLTNQGILSHPGLFPVIFARLHILLHFQ